jgi:ribosome-associated protein
MLPIDPRELTVEFVRASGPGGQNVNKVATAVQLRFHVGHSTRLSADAKSRLRKLAGRLLNSKGEIVILARRFRSQDQNREDAIARLASLLERAKQKPKPRTKTKPTRGSVEKRLDQKRKAGKKKMARSRMEEDF